MSTSVLFAKLPFVFDDFLMTVCQAGVYNCYSAVMISHALNKLSVLYTSTQHESCRSRE